MMSLRLRQIHRQSAPTRDPWILLDSKMAILV